MTRIIRKSGWFALILFMVAITISCKEDPEIINDINSDTLNKINFSIDEFTEDGLYGEPDGLRALDYKFCMPTNDSFKIQVLKIDSTIKIFNGTGRKNNCSESEYFCIGNTHKKDFKEILINLASLEYISSIEPHYWEQ